MTIKIDNEQRAREQFARLFTATPKQPTNQASAPAVSQRKVWRVSK